MTSLEKALRDFAQFAAKLKGDEKSEAQTFRFPSHSAFAKAQTFMVMSGCASNSGNRRV